MFPYYPYIPGPLLPEGASLVAITSDPGEAARAPMGEAIVGDVAGALAALVALVGESDRRPPEPRPPSPDPPAGDPMSGSEAMAGARRRLAGGWDRGARVAFEHVGASQPPAPVQTRQLLLRRQRRTRIGISAAVGVQLAQRGRPVVCVLGEGSAQYGITALWTAVAYKAPVTFLVLRNDEYGILKWFATLEQVVGAPGLELPALDTAAVARG